jgi:hypothetical protein
MVWHSLAVPENFVSVQKLTARSAPDFSKLITRERHSAANLFARKEGRRFSLNCASTLIDYL